MTQTKALRLARVRAAIVTGEAQRLREAARLSIGEIASECGVDQSTVWRWENGARLPRGDQALRYGDLIDSLREQAQGVSVTSTPTGQQAAGNRAGFGL